MECFFSKRTPGGRMRIQPPVFFTQNPRTQGQIPAVKRPARGEKGLGRGGTPVNETDRIGQAP